MSELKREGRAAAASNASHLLALAREGYVSPRKDLPGTLAKNAVAALAHVEDLGTELRDRLGVLLAPIAAAAFLQAANDLDALDRFSGLPGGVLSGTGAAYPSRAIGLEVMRRGGAVERYEHGGPLGMISSFEGMLLSDMTVSTRYVMMSKPKVDLFNGLGPARLFPNLMKVDLRSGGGDSNFAAIPSGSVKSPHARRKKILYGATVFRRHQQHEQPLLMDMVYMDWQIRLVEELNKLPADVVLKPHPQNPSDAWRRQFAGLCDITDVSFEKLIPDADVIVCDYPQSTTFWASLCSDRPVVLVDLGISPLNSALAEVYDRRCTIVDASYDGDGLPQIRPDALGDAINGALERTYPGEIRQYFAAD